MSTITILCFSFENSCTNDTVLAGLTIRRWVKTRTCVNRGARVALFKFPAMAGKAACPSLANQPAQLGNTVSRSHKGGSSGFRSAGIISGRIGRSSEAKKARRIKTANPRLGRAFLRRPSVFRFLFPAVTTPLHPRPPPVPAFLPLLARLFSSTITSWQALLSVRSLDPLPAVHLSLPAF